MGTQNNSTSHLDSRYGITGEIWAGGNVDLNANESITGKVTSLGDVHIDTWKSSKGDVSASRDIIVNAGFSITGSLTAGRNVNLWSGSMTNVTLAKATTGDVDAETWGIFKGVVQAPAGVVSIWSASDTCETTITAHDSVSVYSYGKVGANITTAADAYVFGNGDVTGVINAVTLIDVGSYGNLDIQPTTAGTSDIYSLGNAKVVGDADKGFVIVSDGSLEVDVTAVDGDVITWSLDETRGSIEAGKYADSVSWGTTNLDTKGEDGAYAWSYGNLSGKLTSSSGYAIGISLWNNSADYDSYIISAAIAGGNITGMVSSDGDTFAFAGGNISSAIVWGIGGDAIALSFGTVSSHISAGNVAVVVAAQNITNIVHGDYAAVAFAGGNLDATVTTDGNVWLAAAGGNITGAITAHDTVWDVFAWGSINATITAGDETGGTGVVSSVESIGPISGQIIATSSIGAVRSGSTVTATLTAPVKPVPIQNDAAVAQENPPLGPWDSGIVDIRIAVAARRAEWVTKREEAVAARDADLDELTDERTAQLNRLAAGYNDRKQEGLSVVIPNRFDELILEQSQFDTRMNGLKEEQTSEDQYLWSELHRLRAEEATARLTALQNAAIAYGNSVTAYQQTIGALNMQKEQIAINRAASIKNLEDAKKSFDAEAPTVWKQTKDWAAWGGTMLFHVGTLGFFTLDGRAEHGRQLGDVLGADGGVDAADYVTIVAYSFEDFAGGLSWYKSYTGVDPLTGVELSDRDRKFGYVFGALEFASAVGAVVFIAGGFRVKGPNCFVGDTPIVIGIHDTVPALAVHPPIDAANNSPWAAVCILLGAFTGVAVLVDERRKRNVLHPVRSLGHDSDDNTTDQRFQDADSLTMLSETVASVGAACRAGLPVHADHANNSNNQTRGTDHTPSLLRRSSGEKVADRPHEGLAVDCQPKTNSQFANNLKIVSVLTVLFGLWLGFGSKSIDPVTASAIAEAVATPAPTPKYETITIREIQPAGYKVLADNPQTPGQAAGDFGEFDLNTWQVHRFLMEKPDDGWVRIGLARPTAWIESVARNDSGQVWLEFEELGIADWATLQDTEPCPTVIVGEGRLVTGTFAHSSGEVLSLFVAGEAIPIGCTANHPFWSEDRQDFVQAGSLKPGEHLRLADGRTTTLKRAEPIAEKLPVYNLEVDGEHVYYVGESGMLVHNACEWHEWKIGEHALQSKRPWSKIFGDRKPSLDDIRPYVNEVLEKGQWRKISDVRGKGGRIIGEKLEASALVNGHEVWVSAFKDLAGRIILNNAGVN